MLQNIRFTIAAGETKRFELDGRYLEIIDSAAAIDLQLTDDAGGTADRAMQVLSGTFVATPFRGFTVTSATAQTVELLVTSGSGGTRRQPGIVAVVDGERQKVIDNRCFSGVASIAGGTGGPRLQLWNISTNRIIFVTAVTIGSSAADTWGLLTCSNALTSASGNTGYSHDVANLAATAGQLRQENANQVLTASQTYRVGYVQATTDRVVVLPRPLRIPPGYGAVVYLNGVGSNLRASFEFEEWPVL